MVPSDLIFLVGAGAAGLLLGAAVGGLARERSRGAKAARGPGLGSAVEAFEAAIVQIDGAGTTLLAGEEALATCAAALAAPGVGPRAILDALAERDPAHARDLEALEARGEACDFEVPLPGSRLAVTGRAQGGVAWLRLCRLAGDRPGLPAAARLAAFLDTRDCPAWIADADGAPLWANRAWLKAVDAADIDSARAGRLSLDHRAETLAREASAAGEARHKVLWTSLAGRRRALRFHTEPLAGGGVGVWADDVTQAEAAAETLGRHLTAHDLTLHRITDAVVVWDADRRMAFHNPAFAELWRLEPAWLAERPTHGEWLDRLRQRRLLPETVDYGAFKAEELARHRQSDPSPPAIWRLPDERTLRVAGQPHPSGGLTLLFGDITPELRLKSQFNQLIQVQKATLDKLTDAVAVFGADSRLKLHNEAFATFWGAAAGAFDGAVDFDAFVEHAVRRLHDLRFWRDLKGRITDPDPRARAPARGEAMLSDGRWAAWQSRPLPDGATLISFTDISDARRLKGALKDREAALSEVERLKRDFVSSVSYELRTPLTTIVGYSELLERADAGLPPRLAGYVKSIRSAATALARSIDNVLAAAELEAGEMALETRDVDVTALLASALARWRPAAESASAVLRLAADSEGGLIRGDPRRLDKILDHLAENALGRASRGGEVTVGANLTGGEICLRVTDTGPAIPFHVQAHVFDRFSGEDRGGAGLPLFLVKALVELHGGWVALESDPSGGAVFSCHLPQSAGPSDARPELF